MAKPEDDVQRDLRAYERFMSLLGSGEAGEAYRLFERRPGLVEQLSIPEIVDACADFRRYVGDGKAVDFTMVVARGFMELFGNILPMADGLCDFVEGEDFRRLTEGLDERYRKWLERREDVEEPE